MNSERIKEIHQGTAYPNSISVHQALLQVWNECAQERRYGEEEVEIIIQKLMNDVHCGNLCYGHNVIDFKLSPRQWFEQFKNK